MSALVFSTSPGFGAPASQGARDKFTPLAIVLVLHLFFFYALYSGLLARAVKVALPDAVYVTFVTPPPPPKAAALPVQKVAALALPPAVIPPPQVQITNTEPVITSAPPTPVEKAPAPVVAAAPVAPVAAAGPKTVTSGVEYIQAPQPVYPAMSKRMGEQGRVILRVLVNEKGLPDQVIVHTSSGSTRLDEAGRQAAQRAQFKPHMEDGRPVAVFVLVPLNFLLAT